MDSVKEDDVDVLASVTLPPASSPTSSASSNSHSSSGRRPFTVDVPLPALPSNIHANPDSHPLSDAPDPLSSAAARQRQAEQEGAAAAPEDQNQQRPYNVATHRLIVHTLYGDRPTIAPEFDSPDVDKEPEIKYDDSIPRVAVVIGASRDLGFAIVRLLLQQRPENLHVVLCARQEKAAAAAAALLLAEGYSHVTPFAVDICDESSLTSLVEKLKRDFPSGVDYLINNASLREIGSSSPSVASRMMSTNFFSALHLTEAFLPIMNRQQQARIVHVSCSVVNHTFRSFHPSVQSALTSADLSIPQLCILMQQYLDAVEDATAARKYGFGAWVAYGVSKIGVMQFMRILATAHSEVQDEKKSSIDASTTSCTNNTDDSSRKKSILFSVADPGQWSPAASTASIADSVASFVAPTSSMSTSSSSTSASSIDESASTSQHLHVGVVSTVVPRGQRTIAACAKSVVDCCHLPDDAVNGIMRYEGREVPLK